MRTRRGPSAVARCAVVAAAVATCAAAPGVARADGFDAAGLADQIQAATWSQVSGAAAAQPSAHDLAQTITDSTRAAVAEASPTVVVAGRGDSPKEAPRAAAKQIPRVRVHEKARPRPAAAAVSPILGARPAEPAEPVEVRAPEPRETSAAKRPEPPGASRAPRQPSTPFDLPSIPVPFAVPTSAGAASGGGSPVPPLLVALVALVLFFLQEVVLRRVPPRRPARPRRIVLPTWRPG